MATRLYFQTSGPTPGLTPSSWSTGWNKTTGTTAAQYLAGHSNAAPFDFSYVNTTNAASGTSGHFTAIRRFIYGPLQAQTISGTLKGQMKGREVAAGDNYTLAVAAKVIQADGTDRGVLLAVSASDDTSATPPEFDTANEVNRKMLDSSESASLTLSSVSVSEGDYLVVECGFRQASTSTNNGTNTYGCVAGNSDLPEDNTDATAKNSWVEFSGDILTLNYIGTANTPADGPTATNTADPTAVTPPSGMISGDLVCMVGHQRATGATLAISADGGQSWTSETAIGITNSTSRLFWCVYDGTWDTNPSVDFSGTTCNSVQMHVFRAPSGYTWSVNQALAETEDATSPYENPGQTTTGTDPTVTLVGWFTADDNSWSNPTGTDWRQAGTGQYRNTSGSDHSAAYAYKIQTAAGATGAVSKTQTANGADACTTFAITFAATSSSPNLTPSLYDDSDTFYTQTVTPGAVGLTPSVYTSSQTFYTQVVALSTPLTPSLYTDDDTFYTQTVAVGAVDLAPSLFADGDTFYTQVVATGAVDLAPSLYTDADTFYTQTLVSTYALAPSLFTDDDTFHSPTITTGAVDLAPSLYTDTDTFFTQTVLATYALTPSLYADDDTFHSPAVTVGAVDLTPSLFADGDTFFTQAVTYGLTPDLYANSATFYAPTVAAEGGTQDLTPSLYADDDTFHAATLAPGAVDLTPSLYTDADTFFTPLITTGGFVVEPSLFEDADTFHSATVTPGAVDLAPSLYTDADTFYTQTVSPGAVDLAPSLYVDADSFYSPIVASGEVSDELGGGGRRKKKAERSSGIRISSRGRHTRRHCKRSSYLSNRFLSMLNPKKTRTKFC